MTASPPLRVLLVEDNPGDAHLIKQMLNEQRRGKFAVEWKTTLGQALEHLDRGRVDALIVDLSLPDSHGMETFAKLRQRATSVPVLVMTGLDDEEVAMQAVREGAQDYLVKGNVSGDLLGRSLRYAVERCRTEQQLQQAQKLESLGRLSGGIAHDFNNLLLVISGYSELLVEKFEAHPAANRALCEIQKAARRGASLTRQLLAFSRQQVLSPRVLRLNDVVGGMEVMLRRLIGEDIELETVLDPDLGWVRADRSQLEQILMNLTINARDAILQHGVVTVETSNVELEEEREYENERLQAGSYVLIAVSDTGSGMDQETRRLIFEPFFTTKAEGTGTGLGLSTVHGIVKQSGGYISVTSEPERGTTFSIYLPRVPAEEIPEQEVETPAAPVLVRREGAATLLLVDDDPIVRNLSRILLERSGYKVLEATGGRHALEICERHGQQIDLLIADVVMPYLGGPALAERLRQTYTELRAIFLSGYPTEDVLRRGVLNPDTNFLQKPFTGEQLLKKVERALSKQPLRAEHEEVKS